MDYAASWLIVACAIGVADSSWHDDALGMGSAVPIARVAIAFALQLLVNRRRLRGCPTGCASWSVTLF